ncbi:MAG: polysaccharide deacetylase family protein [Candidatus Krumholzibacteria bacterium]|jgi:hypothetical protein|nr:polysaccharide deacetylase family protein [Candidatus Krumholzibacteria bacterium]MDP6668560.1 polysaccharide deacetylase family protein [Candidatus Krumholzibacteria bacterium]MDP6796881.1 polysaccharide deacetylase family protein [Candidatus Krumholzibacteria bacterium]MDP7021812.1 polysaccharide deacetylase family protein [Candidatus Krumholzibacteria bacterium]
MKKAALFLVLLSLFSCVERPLPEVPLLLDYYPSSALDRIPVNIKPWLLFSEPMDSSSVCSSITLSGSWQLDFEWEDTRLRILPQNPLSWNLDYELSLSGGRSREGVSLEEEWSLDFHTSRDSVYYVLLGEWYLTKRDHLSPRIETLAELRDTLIAYGVAMDTLSGHAFRLGFNGDDYEDWIAEKSVNSAGCLREDSVVLGLEADTLFTHGGLSQDSLGVEILENADLIESITGEEVQVLAFPNHHHTRNTLHYLRDQGYLAARNGTPGYEPWASFLLWDEEDRDDPWIRSWERVSLFEMPLTFFCSTIQAMDPSEIADWLQEEEQLPRWKENRTWIQFYTHTDDPEQTGTPILDAEHLEALMDALIADGDVWIAPLGEVAEFVRSTHIPEDAEELIWVSDDPSPQPWDGHSCAFTFSTDDGFRANIEPYALIFSERGIAYTSFLNGSKILDGDAGSEKYMGSVEVQAMVDLGMELGSHSLNHRSLIPNLASSIRDLNGDTGKSVYIYIEPYRYRYRRVLQLWQEKPTSVP